MKKIKITGAVFAFLFLCSVSFADTFTYVEKYTAKKGSVYVKQNGLKQSFDFDFVNEGGNTNKNFNLTEDASGMTADEIWTSAFIDIEISDDDGDYDVLKLVIQAAGYSENYQTDKMDIGDSGWLFLWRWSKTEEEAIHYDLSDEMMLAFSEFGKGRVTISAPDIAESIFNICQFNDFYLASVTMTVNTYTQDTPNQPVPEPATLLLMGTGLAGLVRYRRKKK